MAAVAGLARWAVLAAVLAVLGLCTHPAAGYDPDQRTLVFGPDPCTCDLKPLACDADCCCDPACSCSSAASTPSPALSPTAKQQTSGCFSTAPTTSPTTVDWQQLLCVARDNSPLVGLFYPLPTQASSEADFTNLKTENANGGGRATTTYSFVLAAPASSDPNTLPLALPLPLGAEGVCSNLTQAVVYEPTQTTCLRPAPTCAPGSPLDANVYLPAGNISAPEPRLDGSLCLNALVELQYVVITPLHNVSATARLATVSAAGPLAQTFGITFVASDSNSDSDSSLRPGYTPGRELVAGSIVRNTSINATALPMLTSDAVGRCREPAEDDASRLTVAFGQDAVAGCSMQVAEAELGDCAVLRTRVAAVQAQGLLRAALDTPAGIQLLGRFADASPSSYEDWTAILLAGNATDDAAADDGGCSVLAGVELEVLVVPQGQLFNPQLQVLSAQLRRVWTVWRPSTSLRSDTATSRLLYNSVTFTRIADSVAAGRRRTAPTPNSCRGNRCWDADYLFYPFKGTAYAGDADTRQAESLRQQAVAYGLGIMLGCIAFVAAMAVSRYNPRW